MVATSKILALGCSVIVAIGLPVALLLWWHKRTKASWRYRHDAAGDASLHVGDGALQDR
jgi:hypothetical protein